MTIDLTKYLFVDNHAHSLLKRQGELDAFAIRRAFSESRSRQVIDEDVPQSLHYRHMLKQIGPLFGGHNKSQLIELRSRIPQAEYVRTLFDDVFMISMVVDDGFESEQMMPIPEFAAVSGRTIFPCRRIETVIEQCIKQCKTFDECIQQFAVALFEPRPTAPVALKTIMAYRGGLQLDIVSIKDASNDFDAVKLQFDAGITRIERRPIYHYMLLQAFELAGCNDVPVQLHTGIGDDDASIADCDPALFQSVIKMPTLQHTKFVLLHCYPFVRQAALLCSLYPNVYMDLSLAVNLVSPAASHLVLEALSVAAPTKLLAGTDGHTCPESHWYAATIWKQALSRALGELEQQSFIDAEQASDIASAVLHGNAIALYKLDGLV